MRGGGIRCSWIDLEKAATELGDREHGSQKRMATIKCASKQAIAQVAAACEVLDVLKDKKSTRVDFEHFTPSHAAYVSRHFRKKHKPTNESPWSDDTKDQIIEWIEDCEANEWTVEQQSGGARHRNTRIHFTDTTQQSTLYRAPRPAGYDSATFIPTKKVSC